MELSRLTRDGTAKSVSRDQILRREWRQGNIHFPCSTDHEQDGQPYLVDPYSCYMCYHIYIYIYVIIIIINGTLARSLEPVVTEWKEHTIHTQTQAVASRKPKEIKRTHEGEANFTT